MNLSRKEFLKAAGLTAGALSLLGINGLGFAADEAEEVPVLPESYDEVSISVYRQKIYEYLYTRYSGIA